MKRNIFLLSSCQALWMSSNSLMIATSFLVGAALAPGGFPALATVPLGLMFGMNMLSTIPASLFMKYAGRRSGFLLGAGLGIAGGAVAATGIAGQSFILFCIGHGLLGVCGAFAVFYRFAAADAAAADFKSTAISLVMAGGVVAAFTGPNLARATRDWFGGAEFAGGYLAIAILYSVAFALLWWTRIPRPGMEERAGGGRAMAAIAAQPAFIVAAAGAMIAYGVMNVLMTASPLAMQHHGHGFTDAAFAIQWHVLGMFAPSFFTGRLIRRCGVLAVMAAGAVLLFAAVTAAYTGTSVAHFWSGLVLLGVGWNFLYIGGTTLLTEVYRPSEKAKTQGVNDFLVSGATTATALSTAALYSGLGWHALNLAALPFIGVALLLTLWLLLRRRPWMRAQS
ncbi:MAG: MFS transporter [Gammaproteobacteria bacterium]|nr:MFS transporter [Gammaproteobacteria bacterium]